MTRPCPRPPQRRQFFIIRITKMLFVIILFFLLEAISSRVSLLQKSFHAPTAIVLKLIKLTRRPLRHKSVRFLSECELLLSHIAGKCARSSCLKDAGQNGCEDDKGSKSVGINICSCICLFLFTRAVSPVPPFPIFPSGIAERTVVEAGTLAVLLTSGRGRRIATRVSCGGGLCRSPACAVGVVGAALRWISENLVS